MAEPYTARNERARAAAEKAGRDTYHHEIIDYRAGCSRCGHPIRVTTYGVGPAGQSYGCGCPGVRWRITATGWVRVAPTHPEPGDWEVPDRGH